MSAKSIGKRPQINDENCKLVASIHDVKPNECQATCGKMQHSFSYRNDANSNKSWIIRQKAAVTEAAAEAEKKILATIDKRDHK